MKTPRAVLDSSASAFARDFADLEKALAKGIPVPVERMILELRLTPAAVLWIKRQFGFRASHYFSRSYRAMRRHGLPYRDLTWREWLQRYRKARKRLGLSCATIRPSLRL